MPHADTHTHLFTALPYRRRAFRQGTLRHLITGCGDGAGWARQRCLEPPACTERARASFASARGLQCRSNFQFPSMNIENPRSQNLGMEGSGHCQLRFFQPPGSGNPIPFSQPRRASRVGSDRPLVREIANPCPRARLRVPRGGIVRNLVKR
eukprot:scaffold1177_cov126-Isochrysis_galbana.AAC.4